MTYLSMDKALLPADALVFFEATENRDRLMTIPHAKIMKEALLSSITVWIKMVHMIIRV